VDRPLPPGPSPVILRYAGGREVTLRELQSMGMTSGINALIVGNYLTTLGPLGRRGPPDAGRPAHAGGRDLTENTSTSDW
jgi:hypothetical protein